MQNHINPNPSEHYSSYTFLKRKQHDKEYVADYVTILGELAKNCWFRDA